MTDKYIVSIGYNIVDEYYEADHYPALGDKSFARFLKALPGGVVPNVAAVLGSLGARSYLFDAIGDDQYTHMILQDMQDHCVNTQYVEILDGIANSKTHIVLSSGEKTIFVIENPRKRFIRMDAPKQQLLDGAAYVYTVINSLKATPGYRQMMEQFCSNGAKLVLDAENSTFVGREEDAYFFQKASIIIFNEYSYKRYTSGIGDKAFDQLLNGTDKIILVTLGAAGSRVITRAGQFHIPAYQVTPVDTTGAGDTFNAAFLYGLLQEWPLQQCAEFSTAAAARSILEIGPRAGAVKPAVIYEFMKRNGGTT